MMVRKYNPKGITADLGNLTSADYYVVLCNPNSGSIGKETKRILQKRGIFAAAQDNARKLTTDSKALVQVLRSDADPLVGHADDHFVVTHLASHNDQPPLW